MAPVDESPLAPSSGSSSTDDFCYVFTVELERGPSGLGMGLIDGMVSWLGPREGLCRWTQGHLSWACPVMTPCCEQAGPSAVVGARAHGA